MTPNSRPISTTFSIDLPNTAIFRLQATAASKIWLTRKTLEAKVETNKRPGVFFIWERMAFATIRSEMEEPGTDELVESDNNKSTPI